MGNCSCCTVSDPEEVLQEIRHKDAMRKKRPLKANLVGESTITDSDASNHHKKNSSVIGGGVAGSAQNTATTAATTSSFNKGGELSSKYEIVKLLGVGSIGQVSLVRRRKQESIEDVTTSSSSDNNNSKTHIPDDENRYALKTLRLGRVSGIYRREMEQEVEVIRNLDHPNIVKAYDVFREYNPSDRQQPFKIHLVLDYCSGGDLKSRMPYQSEKQVATIVGKILSALAYMHAENPISFLHRDLKMENIMFESSSDHHMADIKIIDFGLSAKFDRRRQAYLRDMVGTYETMAPEILRDGHYTTQADMFSLGSIAFMMLTNKTNRKPSELWSKEVFGSYEWKQRGISREGRDFVGNLLLDDPNKRMTAEEAQSHAWMSKNFALNERVQDAESSGIGRTSRCSTSGNGSKLYQVGMLMLAYHSSLSDINALRKIFDKFDSDNSGIITKEQFIEGIKEEQKDCHSPLSRDQLEELFNRVDIYKNGVISYTEFLAAALDARGNVSEEAIADAFDRMDRDKSGFISEDDLLELLGRDFTKEKAKELIKEVDNAKDGKGTEQGRVSCS